MTRIIDDSLVETATRVLLGAIDTGDGGTDEQRAVLSALVAGYWERPDIDVGALDALDPEKAEPRRKCPGSRRTRRRCTRRGRTW